MYSINRSNSTFKYTIRAKQAREWPKTHRESKKKKLKILPVNGIISASELGRLLLPLYYRSVFLLSEDSIHSVSIYIVLLKSLALSSDKNVVSQSTLNQHQLPIQLSLWATIQQLVEHLKGNIYLCVKKESSIVKKLRV